MTGDGPPPDAALLRKASHDLRGPLQAITLSLDILAREIHGPMTPLQLEDLARARRALEELTRVADELTRLSRPAGAGPSPKPADL